MAPTICEIRPGPLTNLSQQLVSLTGPGHPCQERRYVRRWDGGGQLLDLGAGVAEADQGPSRLRGLCHPQPAQPPAHLLCPVAALQRRQRHHLPSPLPDQLTGPPEGRGQRRRGRRVHLQPGALHALDQRAQLSHPPGGRRSRVVQLVRHPRGERPQGGELLGLAQHHLLVEVAHLQLPQPPPVPSERVQDREGDQENADDVKGEQGRHQPRRQLVCDAQVWLEDRGQHYRCGESPHPPPRIAHPAEDGRQHHQERPHDHRARADRPQTGAAPNRRAGYAVPVLVQRRMVL
jgi:hypothetical protein